MIKYPNRTMINGKMACISYHKCDECAENNICPIDERLHHIEMYHLAKRAADKLAEYEKAIGHTID